MLYEEPNTCAAPLAPSDYEVAVSQGTNHRSVDTYSSVENASWEAQNYMNPNEYTSLHPPNFDREQHIYTPPLQLSSSLQIDSQPDTQPQEVTSVTVEDTHPTDAPPNQLQQADTYVSSHEYTSLHPSTINREQHIYTPPLQRSSSPQPQEHTYFTLDQEGGGGGRGKKGGGKRGGGRGGRGGGGGGGGEGERGIQSSNIDQMAQTQEHTYFTLDKTSTQP